MTQKGYSPILIIFLIGLVLVGIFWLKQYLEKKTSYEPPKFNYNSQPKSPEQRKQLFLIKTEHGKDQEIAIYYNADSLPPMIRYKNWLFFGNTDDNGQAIVDRYDLLSGEKVNIFKSPNDSKKFIDVQSLNIINNKLYISIGGYMTPGGLYVNDLNKGDDTKLIIEGSDNAIKNISGAYWILSGFGDACISSMKVSNFDIDTDQTKQIITTKYDCGEGTTYLGIDSGKRVLIATSVKSENKYNTPIIQKIEAVDLNGNTSLLLSPDEMPKNIYRADFVQSSNKLFLLGDNLYVYHLPDLTQKMIDIPERYRNEASNIKGEKNGLLCLNNNISINLSSGDITLDDIVCESVKTGEDIDESRKTLLKELGLSSEYRFVVK